MLSTLVLLQWRSLLISRLDLRFPEKALEMEFVRSLRKRLLYVCVTTSAILMTFYLLYLVFSVGDFGNGPKIFKFLSGFVCYFILQLIGFVGSLLLLKSDLSRVINVEIFVTSVFSIACILVPWTTDWMAARIFGFYPEDAFGIDTHAHDHTVLSLVAASSALSIFYPLRVCYKWFPPTCGIISYIVGAVLYPNTALHSTLVLLFVTFCALCGAWQNEKVARQRFTSELIVRKSSHQLELQHESNSRILERLCDTLLHLDHNFCIVDPEPRFEALLLCSKRDNIRTRNFLDFLASDKDRALVTSTLNGVMGATSDIENPKTSGLVQVSLCDMHGREFPVYLYHASIYDLESRCGHMVALVEVQERSAPFPDHLPQDTPLPAAIPDDGCSVGDRSSETMSLGSEVPLPLIEGRTAEVLAWIDMSSVSMNFVQCSVGFTVFGPISEGSNLAFMLGDKSDEFRKAMQRLHNQYQNDDVMLKTSGFKVKLKPLEARGVEFSALCTLDVDSLDSTGDGYVLPVLFNEVRCHYRRRRSDSRALAAVMRNALPAALAVSL